MKKSIKIILVAILIIILNMALLINTVNAVEKGPITIYTKGYFKRVIRNNGIVIKTAEAVYEENGIEYPAYCLDRELHGVGDYIANYDVTNEGKITDVGLWRVIINGYPYKTIEELGVQDKAEAYMATKQAIYCYIYGTGTESYTPAVDGAGNRVINAINTILENAEKTTESFEDQKIDVIQSEKLAIEGEYITKQYEVKSDINISKFIIELENAPIETKVTNLKNQDKNEFDSSEKFKILIPIKSLEKSGEFKIKIKTLMETKPIFFGRSPNEELQNYALTAFSYQDVSTELNQQYEENKTKIIIQKVDSETKQPLKSAKFEVLDKDKKVVIEKETDENGQIILKNLVPGVYYIREIKAPEGYEDNKELNKIEININEKKTLEVKNNKIIIEEPPVIEEPPKIEKPPIVEEPIIELPKLPVTGM